MIFPLTLLTAVLFVTAHKASSLAHQQARRAGDRMSTPPPFPPDIQRARTWHRRITLAFLAVVAVLAWVSWAAISGQG